MESIDSIILIYVYQIEMILLIVILYHYCNNTIWKNKYVRNISSEIITYTKQFIHIFILEKRNGK